MQLEMAGDYPDIIIGCTGAAATSLVLPFRSWVQNCEANNSDRLNLSP